MLQCTMPSLMPVPLPDRPTRALPSQTPGVYPVGLEGAFQCGDERLAIRPIRPTDEAAEADFFAHLTPEDVRFRFFSALRQLPPRLLFRLTHIDYVGEMAFVAERPSGEIVGVARLVRDPDASNGEYAVAIRPDMKGHGLANHLMGRVLDWGRSQGMTHVHAMILADNGPMIAFARKLGGRLKRDPQDSSVVRVEMLLTELDQSSSGLSPPG